MQHMRETKKYIVILLKNYKKILEIIEILKFLENYKKKYKFLNFIKCHKNLKLLSYYNFLLFLYNL